MKKFWNLTKTDNVGELTLYGEISSESWFGDEITPAQFRDDLGSLGDIDTLNIYINSGGGDVFAGIAIYNILKRHPANKVVYIDGLAASIASIVAMAGDRIVMPKNAMLMIHNAWTIASGNKNDLRKMADELEGVDSILVDTYVARSGLEAEEIRAMMDAETWLTASEAVDKGFADELEESKLLAACLTEAEMLRYSVPAAYYAQGAIEPCNGGDSQPVEEIDNDSSKDDDPAVLEEQRKHFSEIRKKLYERT